MKNYHYHFLFGHQMENTSISITLSEISGRCSLSLHKGKSGI